MEKELIDNAIQASSKAYAPYSRFKVGAALLLKNGKIIQGCNVENASYGMTNCAERTALFTSVAQGYKSTDIETLAIYVNRAAFTPPCGACRQVIAELAPNATILLVNDQKQVKTMTIGDLLPLSFGSADLEA